MPGSVPVHRLRKRRFESSTFLKTQKMLAINLPAEDCVQNLFRLDSDEVEEQENILKRPRKDTAEQIIDGAWKTAASVKETACWFVLSAFNWVSARLPTLPGGFWTSVTDRVDKRPGHMSRKDNVNHWKIQSVPQKHTPAACTASRSTSSSLWKHQPLKISFENEGASPEVCNCYLPQDKRKNYRMAVLPEKSVCGRKELHGKLNHHKLPRSQNAAGNTTKFVSMYEKAFAPPSSPMSSLPKIGSCLLPTRCNFLRSWQKRYPSTIEQIFQHEEKEKYQQLVRKFVPFGSRVHSPLASQSSSSPPSLPRGYESPISFGDVSPVASPSLGNGSLSEKDCSPGSGTETDSLYIVKTTRAPKKHSSSSTTTINKKLFDSEQWIKNLHSKYLSNDEERKRSILEESMKMTACKEKRAQAEWDLEKSIRIRLSLAEKQVFEEVLKPETWHEDPAEEEFPLLSEKMEEEVDRALRPGNADEVLSEAFRQTVTRKDIKTLHQLNWLNDEVINFYMNLIMKRSKRENLPNVHVFNTFFYPRIRSGGFQGIKRWTKKVDIFAADIILVPVHLDVHWCLASIDLRKRTISYYDSMGNGNQEACHVLLNYLKEESLDKKGRRFLTSEWRLHSKSSREIPQQMNGSDCGMFTCKYADYIAREKPITFLQKHMPYFRRRMVWEILHQKLL
uniref:sentrin-specific protease 1-like isoform X2 n=1 Tax=Myxine glutinosa TaxID=7769 RepID=UPI00358F399D